MLKWRRKILAAVVAAGLLCLLAACNQAQVSESVQPDDGQEAVQADDLDRQEATQPPIEEQPVSTDEWFNDDWRDDLPSPDNQSYAVGDFVVKKDITMQVEGSNFTVADYQRIIRDYLKLYGSLWLEASAQQPDDEKAITGFQVVKDAEIVCMTPTGEVPAIFECRMNYALAPKNSLHAFLIGSGREDYPEAGWYSPTSNGLFQIDSNNTLSYLTGFTDSWFGGGKMGLIPIGRINDARRLYGWYTDIKPNLGDETVAINGQTYRHVKEIYQTWEDKLTATYRTAFEQFTTNVKLSLPEDVAAELLATDTFIDVDGELYMKERADSTRPQIISEKWSIVEEAWERCVYRAEVVRLEGGAPVTINCDYVFEEGKLVEFDYF